MSGIKGKVWHQLTIADQSFCTKSIRTKLLVCISQHIEIGRDMSGIEIGLFLKRAHKSLQVIILIP